MLIVPLRPVPSQVVSVTLANQNCGISVYQKTAGLFVDLRINDSPVIVGVICQNLNRIVRSRYLGFAGDLMFIDEHASPTVPGVDPHYSGLGSRFNLAYLTAAENPPGRG